jgi:hypothetical protein
MDLSSETAHLPIDIIISAPLVSSLSARFMAVMAVLASYRRSASSWSSSRYENTERWPLIITYAIVLVVAITFVFEHVMHVPWPPTYLGTWFPWLKTYIPSV